MLTKADLDRMEERLDRKLKDSLRRATADIIGWLAVMLLLQAALIALLAAAAL